MRTYLFVLAGALLLLGQFILPATAGPYLEEGGESSPVFFLSLDAHADVREKLFVVTSSDFRI